MLLRYPHNATDSLTHTPASIKERNVMPVQVNLVSMSIDKLAKLKDQVEAILASKLADERRAPKAGKKLERFASAQSAKTATVKGSGG
jgi:hypothetical protein